MKSSTSQHTTSESASASASASACNSSEDNPASLLAMDSERFASSFTLFRLMNVPGQIAFRVVGFYQYLISPLLGPTCRFYPSCSQYFILSVKKSGLLKAIFKGTWRICRCHPWNTGGYDPP